MALFHHHSGPLGQQIVVWSISETYDELVLFLNNSSFLKEIQNLELKSELRLKQKLAAGILLQHILQHPIELVYDNLGKPRLKNVLGHISITNTKEFVAVIYHPTKPVGIDIEIPSERILKVAPKFVNEQEQKWMTDSAENSHQNCFIVWCVKESVFKLIGGGGIDFKNNIEVKAPTNNLGEVIYSKNHSVEKYQYHLIQQDELLLSYIVGN
ncbi:MAG: 4'-phosphopantetheinyl transferase family protein [Bacteroidota bacterium]